LALQQRSRYCDPGIASSSIPSSRRLAFFEDRRRYNRVRDRNEIASGSGFSKSCPIACRKSAESHTSSGDTGTRPSFRVTIPNLDRKPRLRGSGSRRGPLFVWRLSVGSFRYWDDCTLTLDTELPMNCNTITLIPSVFGEVTSNVTQPLKSCP